MCKAKKRSNRKICQRDTDKTVTALGTVVTYLLLLALNILKKQKQKTVCTINESDLLVTHFENVAY